MSKLKTATSDDFVYPENRLIGEGTIATVHRCWLKNDQRMKTLAVKIFDLSDASRKEWILGHLVREIMLLHELYQERKQFIPVYHLYNIDGRLCGFTMEYCRHGSIRSFGMHLSKLNGNEEVRYHWLTAYWMLQIADAFNYLQTRSKGAIFHRDLSVDSVLIEDQLGIKIADFGLSKKLSEAAISPSTLDFQQKLGVLKQLPETFHDPLRSADAFGDRYLYGLLVVEAFGQVSIREKIGDQKFIELVKSGKHIEYLQNLLNDMCFERIPSTESDLMHLKETVMQVVQDMSHQIPEQRLAFADICSAWQRCGTFKMNQERLAVLKLVQEELNLSIAPDLKGQSLRILWNTEVDFREESLIGKGSFAVCHLCQLKDAPDSAPLALKIFKLDEHDMSKRDWHMKHLVHEIRYMHELGKKESSFIKVLYIYFHEVMKLIGYAMEYCKHGSLRLFSKRLSTMQSVGTVRNRHPWLVASWMLQVSDGFEFLQNRDGGGILHRDLAVDNVLIDDLLNAKIADFGLSKRSVESIATQNTMTFERLRGIERRLPESYDDPLRQPDIYGDRYLYAVFVVEAFGLLSIRQVIGDRIEEFKGRVRAGKHIEDFQRLLNDSCFEKIPLDERSPDLVQLKETTKLVVQKMADQVPERRATFAEVSGLWKMCNLRQMDEERNQILDLLGDLPAADTIPSADIRARTVSLGPIREEFTAMQIDSIGAGAGNSANAESQPSDQINFVEPVSDVERSSADSRREETSRQSTVTPVFSVSIGTVGGDVSVFSHSAGSGSEVSVTQHLQAKPADVVHLLQRSYAEIVATQELAQRLSSSTDLKSKCEHFLFHIGLSDVEVNTVRRDYTGNKDILFQGLRTLINNRGLTICQLGEALKKIGCLEGLQILLDFE